jgi:ribose 1,5-bisphosphokinase
MRLKHHAAILWAACESFVNARIDPPRPGPRYALYFAPSPDSAWWRWGSAWLGRCAATGRVLPQRRVEGVPPQQLAELTESPRRYGFHATLTAPFRLAEGTRLRDLLVELGRFCAGLQPFAVAPLRVARMDDFLALVPQAPDPRLDRLAEDCVLRFDRHRSRPDALELARRRAAGLTAREDALLVRWGYPYVLDAFRFHMSLTGRLAGKDAGAASALERAAASRLAAASMPPLVVDAVCVFEERAPGAELTIIHRARFAARGRLIYLVGPSGAGKDALIAWARERLPAGARVHFARRTITRPALAGNEGHEAVSEQALEELHRRGELALHWEANGCRYGVRRSELEAPLARAETVVLNGSRAHLPEAILRYPQLEAVHVTAPAAVLRHRLAQRGREDPPSIHARISRNGSVSHAVPADAFEIANDGPLERAGSALVGYLVRPSGARSMTGPLPRDDGRPAGLPSDRPAR